MKTSASDPPTRFFNNQRGRLLEWMLLVRGNERIFTVSAPYYLGEPPRPPAKKKKAR